MNEAEGRRQGRDRLHDEAHVRILAVAESKLVAGDLVARHEEVVAIIPVVVAAAIDRVRAAKHLLLVFLKQVPHVARRILQDDEFA